MKRILGLFLALGLVFGANAQAKSARGNFGPGSRGRGGGKVVLVAPRPIYRPYYDPFAYGYGYPFGYSPFWGWNNQAAVAVPPSRLELGIDRIRNQYSYQIANVRHDKSLSRPERKNKIRQLKYERDQAIIDAKQNYVH